MPLHYLEGIVQGCPACHTNNATVCNGSLLTYISSFGAGWEITCHRKDNAPLLRKASNVLPPVHVKNIEGTVWIF